MLPQSLLPPPRLVCAAAMLLLLLCVAPADPQWRAFRTASSVLAPSYSRDITVPVGELRYPGYVIGGGSASRRPAVPPSTSSSSREQQPPRSRRQYKGSSRSQGYSKQGTFALLRQLISETANETRTAFNQIGDILGSQFSDSNSRPRPSSTTTTTTTSAPPAEANATASGDAASSAASTTSTTTTTTEAPYRISRQELFGILQRNSIGLGRLFRREYDMAMQDSKANLNRFKQEFRMVVAPFLQPATTEAPTTSSSRR